MGGKNKGAGGGGQKPRTKGNVKPSSSDKAANFLVQQVGGLSTGGGGVPAMTLGGGGGSGEFSFARLSGFVPLEHDPDAAHIDADIRMQLRKLDKRDAVTKQKTLLELIPLLEEKPVDALLSALPYWPRIYARLVVDEDRKVRELAQKALAGFAARCGKNIAPYLKQLLAPWIISQCDLFEPAAMAAERAFTDTFPPHKQKDAYLHCWSEIFSLIEDTLKSLTLEEESVDNSGESKYTRTVVACVRTLTKLLEYIFDTEVAIGRLASLLHEKQFWAHNRERMGLVNAAYYRLISRVCQLLPDQAEANAVQFCQATLRRIDDDDSPTTVGPLWEAVLSLLLTLDNDLVWKLVSLRKNFLPKLAVLFERGGNGCARYISPNLLPLFSKLPLSIEVEEEARLLYHLLGKMVEGLHRDRVIVSGLEASAITAGLFECLRYLVAEAVKVDANDTASYLVETFAVPLLREALCDIKAKTFADCVFRHTCMLAAYLVTNLPSVHASVKAQLAVWLSEFSSSDAKFCANFVAFLLHFTNNSNYGTTSSSELPVNPKKKQVSFDDNCESIQVEEIQVEPLEGWKLVWLEEFHDLLESQITTSVTDSPFALMPYFCIASHMSTREQHQQSAILDLCSKLLTEEHLHNRTLCRIIGLGMGKLLEQSVASPEAEMRRLFSRLTDSQAVLFLGRVLPWLLLDSAVSSAVHEGALLALQRELIDWTDQLIGKVFSELDRSYRNRLITLCRIICNPSAEHFASLPAVRRHLIGQVWRSLEPRRPMAKGQLILLADVLLFLVDSLQKCADVEVDDYQPLVLSLVQVYLDYWTTTADSSPLPGENDDDDSDLWSDVCEQILEFYRAHLDRSSRVEEVAGLVEQLFTKFLDSVADCPTSRSGLNQVQTLRDRLVSIAMEWSSPEPANHVFQFCFTQVESRVSDLCAKVNASVQYGGCTLHHSDQAELLALVRILNFLHPFAAAEAKYDLSTTVPNFWLPFAVAACLLNALGSSSREAGEMCDQMRDFVLGELCAGSRREDILEQLSRLAVGQSEQCFRRTLHFCMPPESKDWPAALSPDVTSWASDSTDDSRFHLLLDVHIPLLVQARCLDRDTMVGSLHRHVTNAAASETITPDTLLRPLALINALVQVDGGYVFHLFPILMTLHAQCHQLVVDDVDQCEESNPTFLNTISLLRTMHKAVSFCPTALTADQWDLVLCTLSSLTSLVFSDPNFRFRSISRSVLAFHVFQLIASTGLHIPHIELEDTTSEWNDFFAGHIFGALLPGFLLEEPPTDGPCLLMEAMAAALSVCPKKYLLENQLPGRMFACDPVRLPSLPLQTLLNTVAPLLYSSEQSKQLAAYRLCLGVADELAGCLDNDAELDDVSLPWVLTNQLGQFAESAFAKEIRAAPFGSVSPLIKQRLSTQTTHSSLLAYLLNWRHIFVVFRESSPQMKIRYATYLNAGGLFDQLMHILFRIMPLQPVASSQRYHSNAGNLIEDSPALLDTSRIITDHRSIAQLQHLACNLLRSILEDAPALARQWWLAQNKSLASVVEKYTERYITPYLCRVQIEEVSRLASEITEQDNSIEVRGRPVARELLVLYRLSEEHSLEMIVAMPANYPLGQVSVETGRKVGVSTQQWRAWLLQLTVFLQHQNGSILEGVRLWKGNMDKKFEGVEDCMICYSILHGTTFNLPRMQCRVCRKLFHYACMYKWFTTSQNPTCPLCRNLFYDVPHAWRNIRSGDGASPLSGRSVHVAQLPHN